ncbi:MAG: CPBP family glutamic-type intramembrane protease [Myxococcota bacterium]
MTIEDRTTLIGMLAPRRVVLEPGECLLRQGETTERMYLLQQGRLEIFRQALLWTVPALVLLTLGKWAPVELIPAHAGKPVFAVLDRPFTVGPLLGYGVYALLVPIQEFISRGAVQGPLYESFTGSEQRRWFWAIVVSNALFGVTHLHLTITYGFVAFTGGLLWGMLYARQRSLIGPVVSHIVVGVHALYVLGFDVILKGMD